MSDEDEKPVTNIFEESEEPAEGATTHGEDGEHLVAEVSTEGVDLLDHGEEIGAARTQQEKMGVAPPEIPESANIPINNPAMTINAADAAKAELEARFRSEFGDLNVEVNDEDKAAFCRATLHDLELVLNVTLEGVDARVAVAIPPDFFTTMASAAVTAWGKSGYISEDSSLQWMLAFQQLHVWYQVREVNGVPTPWSLFWTDGIPSRAKIKETMDDPTFFEFFTEMHATRWRMLMTAGQIAEYKYKLCMENWQNRGFFTGADSD